ncbi:MAG: hydrolase 1, exosortase A system-associated [Methylomonas sp.]|jgi:exosortase A-associated hydrolase 1|uniref:hydrolase 1, exosortase A system-associated n=1 Tax=Methylomonas sp. TaxID=418 RepID=UPI0025F707B3|nr:hydrolase 1, exosortase A system-associated [Methylomonas sp.]MCK9606062.1 hydrolase 1, exosortase A system-associated [Methylomonas sp.]
MQVKEIPVVFECQGEQLIGMLHQPDQSAGLGVLIVVGGPQYRVGSHRQFLLLARQLAAEGVPVMRFDVRGMGDSKGDSRRFDQLDADIEAAIDCFLISSSGVRGVVLWGLCDAAAAATFYSYQDTRVIGMVLLNPWVFTEQGAAKTYLKHYYWQRFSSPDFWRKIFFFQFDYAGSLMSFLELIKQAIGRQYHDSRSSGVDSVDQNLPLPARVRECLKRSVCPVLLILSGRDLTADEFKDAVYNDDEWQRLLDDVRITRLDFAEADHTFSSVVWRDQVAQSTLNWIKQL